MTDLNVTTTISHVGAPPPAGHNTSTGQPSVPQEVGTTVLAKDQLKSIVARIEQMEEEKKDLAGQIGEIYVEAKGNGFDVKALRTIVRMRKEDPKDREAREAVLDTYLLAMGMI